MKTVTAGYGSCLAVSLVLGPLFSVGCATAKKPTGPLVAENAPPPAIITTEYEYVTVTGSQIPIRVPKGSSGQTSPAMSTVSTMSPEAFRGVMQRAQVRRR